MENAALNKKALILGVQKCLTEWLKGHAYVCFDTQGLINAWRTFHTQDETTMKLFYWFHKTVQFDSILYFELKVVVERMIVNAIPREMAEYNFPPVDDIVQFLQSWCKNRILSLKKNIDGKQKMMMSWSAFDIYDDQILKAYAKVFASGSIADVAKFEEQLFVSSQFRLEESDIKLNDDLNTDFEISPLRSIVNKFVGTFDEIEEQLFDSEETEEISDQNVKKLFSGFLKNMEEKNEHLRKYFKIDDDISLQEDEIEERPASTSSKPAVPEIVPIQSCDKASRAGESEETVQILMAEQSVNARQNSTYSDVAKPGKKEENEAEGKIPAARSPNAGKRRSNFQLPTEKSAKVPKEDEWVKAKKVSRKELDPSRIREAFDIAKYLAEPVKEEEKKDVLPAETGVTSEPVATVKVGLTPQEKKVANFDKKKIKRLEKLIKENERLERNNEELQAMKSSKIETLKWYQKQTSELHVTRFHYKLEEFKKTSQNLTDDLAKKIATRFIEKRIEVLSEVVKHNEDDAQQIVILYFYKLMQTMGLVLFEREHFEQLCMLNTNYKAEMFAELEFVFLSKPEFSNKIAVQLINAKRRMSDPVAARQVFDTLHYKYISVSGSSKRDVNRTNAKLYLDTRINSLTETGEGSSNDSNKLETYLAVSGMDFDNLPLEILQQMGMMNMLTQEADFSVFEPILLEILKSIQ